MSENSTSKFTVRLPDPLDLDANWTVALSSFIYPHSFSLLGGDDEEPQSIDVFRRYGNTREVVCIQIPDLSFANVQSLEKGLNAILLDVWQRELAKGSRQRREVIQESQAVEETDEVKRAFQQRQQKEPALETPKPVEESVEVKKAALGRQKEETLQTTQTVEESDEVKQEVERQKQHQDGQAPLLSNQALRNLLTIAQGAAERAWRESERVANEAQRKNELAEYWYSQARLRFARKDHMETDTKTGVPINVRKTPESIFQWVGEQVTILFQQKNNIAEKAQVCAEAAKTAAKAKDETIQSAQKVDIPGTRKAADRAKAALRTAEDAARQVAIAQQQVERIARNVITKIDQALAEQDNLVVAQPTPSRPSQEPPLETPQKVEESNEVKKAANKKEPPLETPQNVLESDVVKEAVEKQSELESVEASLEEIPKATPVEKQNIPVKPAKYHINRLYSNYPAEYTKMLIGFNKEQLADPKYQWVSLQYDEMHQRFWITLQGNVEFIVLSRQLSYALGFSEQQLHNGQVAKYSPDISGGVHQMMVYAPRLVENSILGNVMSPLLRVVNVQGMPGQTVQDIYTSEYHHRILGKRHSEITIEIRTIAGKLVKFHWGDSILTLHFQRSLF